MNEPFRIMIFISMLGFINYILSLNQQRVEINISLNWGMEVPSRHHFVILCMFRKHEWTNSSKNLLFQQCLQTLFKHVKKQVAPYDLSHVLVVKIIVLFKVTIMVNGVTQPVIIPRANFYGKYGPSVTNCCHRFHESFLPHATHLLTYPQNRKR